MEINLDEWEPGEDVDADTLVREELARLRETISHVWCVMTPDGIDTDGTPWSRCTVHNQLVMWECYICEGYVAPAYQGGH